ncbi:MAG: thioredoxin reductase [bacterium]|nr:thioredoxin reductase [bacterium]
MKETDVLLVGFGFSAIPLLRELDRSGVRYTIVSEKDGSIWASLTRSTGLDFDLVSSYYTSFYTFDLVESFGEDRYPTAREFYDMHLRYYRQYQDRIVADRVTLIENTRGRSIVHTASGERFEAKHVVISTAYRRRVVESLTTFDCSIRDQTVVFDTIGDSANLMISKLVTGDNTIICLQNGFLALDKLLFMGEQTYSLDQLEAHQMARSFPRLYGAVINFNFVPMYKVVPNFKPVAAIMALVRGVQHVLGRLFTPENFHVPFADTRRVIRADRPPKAHVPNGIIAIKYWPIDTYARKFAEELPERITQGFLLNDLPFFVSEGLVKLWSKDDTTVDETRKTIECDGTIVHYDHLIKGDAEVPRLPRITHERDGRVVDYEYVYRENHLGVIPRVLENVYLLGYTRPLTGGLSSITEMQSLLIHRLITDDPFRADMAARLDEKIARYDRKYFVTTAPGPRDHLTYYGFYTDEVARELGIELRLADCRSLRDVAKYLSYPNNPDKFRQTGRYAIDGCADFVDHVFTQHDGFKLVWQLGVTYLGYQLLTLAVFTSLFLHGWIGGWVLAAAVVGQMLFGYWAMIPVTNSCPFFRTKLLSFLLYLPMLLNPVTTLLIFPLDFVLTYALRQLPGARYPFNDLKNKKKHRGFWERYKAVYNRVRRPADVRPAVGS